jgi:hypothetical protein
MTKIFIEYINGRLVRFIEHGNRLYVDTDDVELLLEEPTIN